MPDIDERIAALKAKVEPRQRMTVEECLDNAERSPRLASAWLGMAEFARARERYESLTGRSDDARPNLTLIEGGGDA